MLQLSHGQQNWTLEINWNALTQIVATATINFSRAATIRGRLLIFWTRPHTQTFNYVML